MRNVLIADDHEITRRGLEELLRESFEAPYMLGVNGPEELVEALPTRPWDLVLLDALMPGSGLVENIGSVRAVYPDVPLLVVTGAMEPAYVLQSLQAGAHGLVHKHRAAEELVGAIRRVLKGEIYLDGDAAVMVGEAARGGQESLHEGLSARELEVLLRIAQGQSVKEIGQELFISAKTVSTYITRIREKTGLKTYVDMARYCLRRGLVD